MPYEVRIEDVKLFPQGYSAIAMHPELIRGEPSILLMDIGGWTVDLMRLDNGVPDAASCRSLELGMSGVWMRSGSRCGVLPKAWLRDVFCCPSRKVL